MKSEIVNSPTKCRPLITTSYPTGENASYLQLPYQYELKDIKMLESYLCGGVKVAGVDFQENPQPMPKLKYRTVCIEGVNVESKNKNQFMSKEDYCQFDWVVDLAVPLPLNPEELKGIIFRNIALFSVQNNNQVPINTLEVSPKQLSNSRVYCMVSFPKRQNKAREKTKIFINKIPIGILVPKLQSYQKQTIIQIISEDLTKTINIINQNELNFRVIGRHQGLIPLQNYYKNAGDKDQQFIKLVGGQSPQPKLRNQPLITSEPLSPTLPPEISRKQNKNHVQYILLIVVLALVVGGYILIKIM